MVVLWSYILPGTTIYPRGTRTVPKLQAGVHYFPVHIAILAVAIILAYFVVRKGRAMATKIPPHLAKELQRHVAPIASRNAVTKPGKASSGEEGFYGMGKGATLAACCAFTAATASFPVFAYWWIGPLNEKDGVSRRPVDWVDTYRFFWSSKFHNIINRSWCVHFLFWGESHSTQELTGNQIRRGAFNNSGSRDAGKDPQWDFKTGSRIKDKSYLELFEKDDGPDAIDHEDRLIAKAKRQARWAPERIFILFHVIDGNDN